MIATPSNNPLAKELETFKRLLPSLLDRAGRFALIIGDDLIGTFSTWEDACQAGYQKAGVGGVFLVKKIEQIESLHYFTRELDTSCHI